MTTWLKLRNHLAIALTAAALASCSLFESDPPKLIHTGAQSKLNDPSKVPAHFVVTLDEARLAIPMSKLSWSIYADSHNYYLVQSYHLIQSEAALTSSEKIRQYGHPLSGITRHDIDRINAVREKNRAAGRTPKLSPSQLNQILPNKNSQGKHHPVP